MKEKNEYYIPEQKDKDNYRLIGGKAIREYLITPRNNWNDTALGTGMATPAMIVNGGAGR